VAAYILSALASGIMFARWRRIDGEQTRREWRLYGWFSALMLCSSCVGAVSWTAWMQTIVNLSNRANDGTISPSQQNLHFCLVASL
jgi:hypothetical protein